MRAIDRFASLWPSYDEAFVRSLLQPEHLAFARLEPLYSMRGDAFVDLAFERDGAWLVLPFLRLDGVLAMGPEVPPLAWPTCLLTFAGTATDVIEERVVPWVRSLAIGRFVNDEATRFFRDEARLRDDVETARSASFFGSAPYASVLRTLGPAAYAQRFARDRRVLLRGEDAPNGAALLSQVSHRIAWSSGELRRDEFAKRWFAGLPLEPSLDAVDLYVGPRAGAPVAATSIFVDGTALAGERTVAQAEPIPTEVMISFDLEDAPVLRTFAVTEAAVPLRLSRVAEPSRGGASAGRIALVVRDDADRVPDADTDAAHELARALRAEGFDATVSIAAKVTAGAVDVIHVFDLRHGASLVELVRDAEAADTPIVVTPYADDRRGEAGAGSLGALVIPRTTHDTISFMEYARAFAARRISNLIAPPWYGEAAAVLLARAAAAIVSSPAEATFLRERFNFDRVTVPIPATIPLVQTVDRIASLVGHDEFVLQHAPIEPSANQVFTALAAQRQGLPLVLVGSVANVEYYRHLSELAGPTTVQLREHDLTAGELAGLYARARVIADVGWSARGLHRLARGAVTGSTVVANLTGYAHDLWGEYLTLADPASLDGIAEALRLAWEAQPRLGAAVAARTAERCDPFAGLVAVVSAYQQASMPAVS